jgi:hypothetical protein
VIRAVVVELGFVVPDDLIGLGNLVRPQLTVRSGGRIYPLCTVGPGLVVGALLRLLRRYVTDPLTRLSMVDLNVRLCHGSSWDGKSKRHSPNEA